MQKAIDKNFRLSSYLSKEFGVWIASFTILDRSFNLFHLGYGWSGEAMVLGTFGVWRLFFLMMVGQGLSKLAVGAAEEEGVTMFLLTIISLFFSLSLPTVMSSQRAVKIKTTSNALI